MSKLTETRTCGSVRVTFKSGKVIKLNNKSLIEANIMYYEELLRDKIFAVDRIVFSGNNVEYISY